VGYWFCYQNTGDTTGDDVRIATALVLQEMGQSQNFRVIKNFEVEAKPREDNCLTEMRCCVERRLNDPFEVDLQLYGLVIPGRPHPVMLQTHDSTGRGYQFNSMQYNPVNHSMLMKQTLGIASTAVPTSQLVKRFQFLIGKFRIRSCKHLPIPDHIVFPLFQTTVLPAHLPLVLMTLC